EEDGAALSTVQTDATGEAVELALVVVLIAERATGGIHQCCACRDVAESAGRPIREDVVVGAQILRPLASHQVSFLFVLQCGDDIEVANLLAEYHPRCILLEAAGV